MNPVTPEDAQARPDEAVCQQALHWLAGRRSAWPLQAPGPDAAALMHILSMAARAPDHAAQAPLRIRYVQGAQRQALLDKVLAHPDAQTPQVLALRGKYTAKLTTAPLVMVLAARITDHPKAPAFEQLLSCGAAVMNMMNAAHLLGLHAFWSSTPGVLGDLLRQVMGFAPGDTMLGLLNVGTPQKAPPTPARAPVASFASEWLG